MTALQCHPLFIFHVLADLCLSDCLYWARNPGPLNMPQRFVVSLVTPIPPSDQLMLKLLPGGDYQQHLPLQRVR